MSWLTQAFHPGGGYKHAQEESEKYYNNAQGQLQPYNTNGQTAGNTLQDLINKFSNPQELYNQWSQSYENSPYAQQLLQQNQGAGMDAASGMGLLGSSSALNNIQQGAGNIVQEDRNNYFQKLMDMMNHAGGYAGGMYGVGANAAGQMGQNSMHQGENSAANAVNQYNAGPNMLGQIGKGVGEIATNWLTGGMGTGGFGRGMFS